MTATEAITLIAELGGLGAIAPAAVSLISNGFHSWREALILQRELDAKETKQENAANAAKLTQLENSRLGKRVVWFIVVVSFLILAAGVWVPVLALFLHVLLAIFGKSALMPTVAVEWYWPKNGSFLFWEWESLEIIRVGVESATYTIAILPTFISIAANIVSFFLVNRVRKKLY